MGAIRGADRLKVFISYSRRDSGMADALVDALQSHGFEVTIDRRDLPFGEKWQAELAEFIRLSDTVIWLVSEPSIRSEWVNWELDEVAKRNKRLVPVMAGETPRDKLPRQLGEIHILPATGVFDLPRDLGTLVKVLETNRGWLKEASRLQDRAAEWLAKKRSPALLLSRGALESAERWKDGRPDKAPPPAQEVLDLLLASRQAATRRQRWWTGGSIAVTVFALALAGFAYVQRDAAISQRNAAENQRRVTQELREQTQKTESGLLANSANAAYGEGKQQWGAITTAALLAIEAMPDAALGVTRPHVADAEWQLDRANRELQERSVLAHEAGVRAAAFSTDGAKIVTASGDVLGGRGDARLWDAASGRELTGLSHEGTVYAAAFSSDGAKIVTASGDRTARLWDTGAGRNLAQLGHKRAINAASFSPNGAKIVTASDDRTARLWDAGSGRELARLFHEDRVKAVAFSPDGARIVTASWDKTARIWDAGSGKELARFSHESWVLAASFSPDGARIVTASMDNTARLWDVASGKELARLTHAGRVNSAAFSPDGAKIVTASADKTARLWDAANGKEIAWLSHDGAVLAASFSPDGAKIVTASGDALFGRSKGDARLWDAGSGRELARLGHKISVFAASFSPDGGRIVTASADNTARLWDAGTGKELALLGHEGEVRSAAFSLDASAGYLRIITASENEARLWQVGRSTQQLVDAAKQRVARCLSPAQRSQYFLPEAPPIWCITGPGQESEKDPAKWQPKWPYQSAAWRDWLVARQRGENPPLPASQ